jgi:hypothetical protein
MSTEYTLSISSNIVAWYAAIVATISAVITFYQVWIDRAIIKITYQLDMHVSRNDIGYKEDVEYLVIDVINKGRRPKKIDKVYLKVEGIKGHLFLGDNISDYRNKIITEENPTTTFLVEQSSIDFSKILYIGAMDATGRHYKKYLIPLHKRIYKWILKIINKINLFV